LLLGRNKAVLMRRAVCRSGNELREMRGSEMETERETGSNMGSHEMQWTGKIGVDCHTRTHPRMPELQGNNK
jgi:hypothetical protein